MYLLFEVIILWVCVKMLVVCLLFLVMMMGMVGLFVIDFNIVWIVFGFFLRMRRIIGILWDLFENIKKSSGISYVLDKINVRIWYIFSFFDKV